MVKTLNVLVGVALLAVGLWLLLPLGLGRWNGDFLSEFLIVAKGLIPVILVIVGFLMVWVEFEEKKAGISKKRK